MFHCFYYIQKARKSESELGITLDVYDHVSKRKRPFSTRRGRQHILINDTNCLNIHFRKYCLRAAYTWLPPSPSVPPDPPSCAPRVSLPSFDQSSTKTSSSPVHQSDVQRPKSEGWKEALRS